MNLTLLSICLKQDIPKMVSVESLEPFVRAGRWKNELSEIYTHKQITSILSLYAGGEICYHINKKLDIFVI